MNNTTLHINLLAHNTEFNSKVYRITDGYILLFICLPGIIGNLLALVILSKKAIRDSTTSIYLRVLAAADTAVLVTAMFRYKTYKIFLNDEEDLVSAFHFDAYIEVYVQPFHWIALGVSSFVTLSLSVERYLAVKFPLTVKQTCTVPFVRMCILIIFISTITISLPNFFSYHTKLTTFANMMVVVPIPTEFERQKKYTLTYHTYIVPILWYIIPWLIMLVTNILLAIQVQKSARIRVGILNMVNPNRKLSLLIIMVVVVYMVCNLPKCILVFYGLVSGAPEYRGRETRQLLLPSSKANTIAQAIAEILNVLNSAINIIIYCVVGTKFRNELKTFITCQSCSRHSRSPRINTINIAMGQDGVGNGLP